MQALLKTPWLHRVRSINRTSLPCAGLDSCLIIAVRRIGGGLREEYRTSRILCRTGWVCMSSIDFAGLFQSKAKQPARAIMHSPRVWLKSFRRRHHPAPGGRSSQRGSHVATLATIINIEVTQTLSAACWSGRAADSVKGQ